MKTATIILLAITAKLCFSDPLQSRFFKMERINDPVGTVTLTMSCVGEKCEIRQASMETLKTADCRYSVCGKWLEAIDAKAKLSATAQTPLKNANRRIPLFYWDYQNPKEKFEGKYFQGETEKNMKGIRRELATAILDLEEKLEDALGN